MVQSNLSTLSLSDFLIGTHVPYSLFEGSFTAWFIGTFSALIAEGEEHSRAKNDAVTKALLFCHHFNVPEKLQRAIVSHTKYHYLSNYVVSQEDEVMRCLPHFLRNEVKDLLAKQSYEFLQQIDLFRHLHDRVIGELVLRMESVACNCDKRLYKKGDEADEFYIQRTGESQLSLPSERGHRRRRTIKRGYVVGELCLLDAVRFRRCSLRCKTWSEFYVVQKEDVIECLQSFYGEEWTVKWTKITHILESDLERKSFRQRRVKFGATEKVNITAPTMFDRPPRSASPTAPADVVNGHRRVPSESINVHDMNGMDDLHGMGSPKRKSAECVGGGDIDEEHPVQHQPLRRPSIDRTHHGHRGWQQQEMEEKQSEIELAVVAGLSTPKKVRNRREESMSSIEEESASDFGSSSSESKAEQRPSLGLKRRMSSFRNAKILKLQRSRRMSDLPSDSARDVGPTATRSKSHDSVLALSRNGWSFGRLFGRKEKEQRDRDEDMSDSDGDSGGDVGNGAKRKSIYSEIANGEGLSDGTPSDDDEE